MQTSLNRQVHERVPGGVKFDLVYTVAKAIVRLEHGGILVGEESPLGNLSRSNSPAECRELIGRPRCPFSNYRGRQDRIYGEEVEFG